MSAQSFIIVGTPLQAELAECDAFNKYFSKEADYKLANIDSIDQFDFDTDLTTTLFIIKHFDGEIFATLVANKCHIMGSTALLQVILKSSDPVELVPAERPLHNLAMQHILITFSGIPDKSEAQQLLILARYMGATSRQDVTEKTTHLVAGSTRGSKYRRALELGLPIMDINWVRESFRMAQDDLDFKANLPDIITLHKLKPFHGLHMAFLGFKEDEFKELSELTTRNNGAVVDMTDHTCTHIVIDAISGSVDDSLKMSIMNHSSTAHIVYKEWFWASLEIEGKANEDSYSVEDFKSQCRSRASRMSNVLSPGLDYSRSPDSMATVRASRSLRASRGCIIEEPPATPRLLVCQELLETERNYVHVLRTILFTIKGQLEANNEPILPPTDMKIIFGNVGPIYEVHQKMLETLTSLIETDWKETNCIGKVFVGHSIDLIKAYPPFVNYFEDTKKTINECDANYPRFHAFLRRCQSMKECNRESLIDMLIRPVQRLPSVSLLLNELIKRTDDSNPDKKFLVESLASIRQVMNLINEDKRETEGQIAMFDIVNNIEDCPPNLLSASRRFICKIEARILFMSNGNLLKSPSVRIFLFSDLIEVCKLRSVKRSLKRSNSTKGNGTVMLRRGVSPSTKPLSSHKKEYRHLDDLHLCDVMNVYKTPEAIVIQARPSAKYEKNFRYYPIVIEDESVSESTVLEKLQNCLINCAYLEQIAGPISSDEIDFGFANSLVHSMEKSRLSRVLSIRQSILSPHK